MTHASGEVSGSAGSAGSAGSNSQDRASMLAISKKNYVFLLIASIEARSWEFHKSILLFFRCKLDRRFVFYSCFLHVFDKE